MSDLTKEVLKELRDDEARRTRATELAEVILRELRTPGPHTITVNIPPHRRSPWPVTVEHPDGTVRELTVKRARVE